MEENLVVSLQRVADKIAELEKATADIKVSAHAERLDVVADLADEVIRLARYMRAMAEYLS